MAALTLVSEQDMVSNVYNVILSLLALLLDCSHSLRGEAPFCARSGYPNQTLLFETDGIDRNYFNRNAFWDMNG